MEEKKLVDLSEVTIDHTLDKTERIQKYIQDIGDPYHFRVGDVTVTVSYDANGKCLQELLQEYFEAILY